MGSALLTLHTSLRLMWTSAEIRRVTFAGIVSLGGGLTSGGLASVSVTSGGDLGRGCFFAFLIGLSFAAPLPAVSSLCERRREDIIERDDEARGEGVIVNPGDNENSCFGCTAFGISTLIDLLLIIDYR